MKRKLAYVLALCMVFALFAGGGTLALADGEEFPVDPHSLCYDASPADWGTKYEETYLFGYASDLASPEPLSDSSSQLDIVKNLIFRGLVRYDLTDGILYPVLATEWYPNEDSTVWTFKLREGVKFHDGSTLDADDVVFSFERATDGTQVKVPDTLVGGVLDSVVAVDPMTVEFHLNKPVFDFPYMAGARIWSKDAFDSGMENPGYIGCGPYKWAGQEIGVSYTVEAFEDYFQGCPRSHFIKFKVMPEIDSQIAALQVGEINFMTAMRATDEPIFDSDPKIDFLGHGGATVYFLAWNGRREIANNKNVTDAIYMAFDKEAANIAMFNGGGGLVDSMVGNAASPGFVPIDNPIPFDPEAAKALLAEAGYGEGDLTITCMYFAWCKPIAEVFQACCADIGVNVEMKEIDGSVFRALCEEGEYDVTMTYCGLQTILNYMPNRFFTENGGGNWFGYKPNEEIAAQFAVMDEQRTLDDLLKEFATLQQLCAADSRYIPVCTSASRWAFTSNTEGFWDVYRTSDLDMSSVYILK